MPNFCRATFFFEDGKYSWTETNYINGSFADLTEPLAAARSLADLRTMMLPSYGGDLGPGGGPEMTEVRVSYDDVWRDSLVDTNVKRGGKGARYNKELVSEENEGPEVPYSTALVRLEAGDKYRRPLYLSGVPQKIITDPNGPSEGKDAAWLKAWQNFVKALTPPNTTWGFKVALKNGDGVNEKAVQGAVYGAATCNVNIPNHGFPNANPDGSAGTVIIRNVRNAVPGGSITGRHLYVVLDANHISITGNWPINQAYVSGGFARPLLYQVKAISKVQLVSQTHRKRGVRSGRPLGRSKKRP